ncbi:MAG: hypothetical protein OEZ01_13555 [Candidatus Heimdallarchaeota archaeon]|nr:hypothetical protein [Candidatus Heimdallarchaeota archaeon]
MKLIKFLFLASVLLAQGCSNDESSTTELEGAWSSICFGSGASEFNFGLFDTTFTTASRKIITTYRGSNIRTQVETYSDTNCSNVESIVDASESTLFVESGSIPITFTIGEYITSANGVTVREIDFQMDSNEIVPNIYLLQDSGNTLYFGLVCRADDTGLELVCTTDRPTEINYEYYYTKQN